MKKASHQTEVPHPFGGCNALQQQYQCIGRELSALDFGFSRYGFLKNHENFRVGVSTIPVEVLESYFDDLLAIDVSEDKLFINRHALGNLFQVLSLVGLFGAFAWGFWSVAQGASASISFILTIFMAAPFAVLWHFSPRIQLMRRLGFARILSQEIARRRGGGKGQGENLGGSVFSDLLTSSGPTSVQGASRQVFH